MKGQIFFKIASILMIIGGVIGYIAGVITILWISMLAILAGSAKGTGLFYVSSIILTTASVIQFIAGRNGISACSAPQEAVVCIKWGSVVAVLCIISLIVGFAAEGEFSLVSLVLNFLVPGAYIYGAMQIKNNGSV